MKRKLAISVIYCNDFPCCYRKGRGWVPIFFIRWSRSTPIAANNNWRAKDAKI